MRESPCRKCPCPAICLRREAFCKWAERGRQKDLDHICARSAMGEKLDAPAWASAGFADANRSFAENQKIASSIPSGESLRLVAVMNQCRYRSSKGCGCSGAACSLRQPGKTMVSHLDCFACIQKYPE